VLNKRAILAYAEQLERGALVARKFDERFKKAITELPKLQENVTCYLQEGKCALKKIKPQEVTVQQQDFVTSLTMVLDNINQLRQKLNELNLIQIDVMGTFQRRGQLIMAHGIRVSNSDSTLRRIQLRATVQNAERAESLIREALDQWLSFSEHTESKISSITTKYQQQWPELKSARTDL
ncbi:MAG: hypothetical protein ACPGUD_06845, partial [Parashewanella sp.]